MAEASVCWNSPSAPKTWVRNRKQNSFFKNPMEMHGARSPWVVMTESCMLCLLTAKGSLSKCPRVPSCPRKPVVWKHQATVCPVFCGFRRIGIFDAVPRSQAQVVWPVECRVEVFQADLVGLRAFCGRGGSKRLCSCDAILCSGDRWPWGRYSWRLARVVGIRVEARFADRVRLGVFSGRGRTRRLGSWPRGRYRS